MADGIDPFDELFGDESLQNARAVGRFRPKPKLPPQRKAMTKSSVTPTQSIQTLDSTAHVLTEPIETQISLECISEVVPNHNDQTNVHAFISNSVEESADLLNGFEAIADSLPHTYTDAVAFFASNAENIEGLGTQVSSSIDDSSITCKADVPKDPCPSAEVVVSSVDVHNDNDDRQGTEEMDVMDSILMTDLTTISGQKTNFQPNLKTYEASGSTSYALGLTESGPIQPDSTEKDFSPTYHHDDVVDLSSPGFTCALPAESTSELHFSEESMNLSDLPQLDSYTHMEGLPEIPAKLASRRAKTGNSEIGAALDPHPQQQKASTSIKENETGRTLRQRKGKQNICEIVDEGENEIIASGEFSEEHPFDSAIDEENVNSKQPQVESESQKKNLKRKSKKTENNKEKKTRKSKKAEEASEQEMRAKQKKFPHSTRRRRVDKSLLDIPEDELDPREVSLRDLILLAEHRERQTKTERAAVGAPETQHSAHNSTGPIYDEAYNYRPDENDEDEETPIAEDTTEYFNYQSRMNKTPRVRWSKQDTELFYKALKQFGTDFSMIAQLFPGRSREQIRNKYKKEERQQPLMLREALTTRSKDLSYFEKVIEDFKQIRAKEEKEYWEDSSNQGADDDNSKHEFFEEEEEDGNSKHEYADKEENGDVANDFIEAQNPSFVKGEEDEQEEEVEVEMEEVDDDTLWEQYQL